MIVRLQLFGECSFCMIELLSRGSEMYIRKGIDQLAVAGKEVPACERHFEGICRAYPDAKVTSEVSV